MVSSLLLCVPFMRTIIKMIARFYFGNLVIGLNWVAIRMSMIVPYGIVVRLFHVILVVLLSFGMSLSLEFFV